MKFDLYTIAYFFVTFTGSTFGGFFQWNRVKDNDLTLSKMILYSLIAGSISTGVFYCVVKMLYGNEVRGF
jgi:hypothetical protein